MCKIQTTISMDESVLTELDAYVDRNITNRSAVIQKACEYWLEHAPDKKRRTA